MKKFDIKWILILVLVIILAFGLVACNNGGGKEGGEEEEETPVVDPNKSTPSEFFGALWESSKSIGATPVNPATDKVHIGMAMDLSLTSNDVAELDVGIEFGIVADLAAMNKDSNPDLGDTALMMKAFDKVTEKNWVTLWYFIQDPDYLYFQVQDENFKVAFDAYWNDEFSTLLEGVLQMPIDFLKVDNLLALINGIAKTGGSNWSLDSLVLGDKSVGFNGLLAAFGLDLTEILNNDTVKSILGKNTDTSSLGSILQSMGGVVLDSSGCRKETVNGRTVYTASKLSKTATTLLNGFTDNLFNSISALSLSFGVKDNKIDGLTIAISGKKDLNNTTIKINITELKIEKVNNNESKNVFGIANKAFQDHAKIHFVGYMDASKWGVELDPDLDPTTADIKIGKVKLELDATIDLVGAYATNKTAAKLVLTNDITATNDNDAETVLTAIYKDHVLSLQTDLSSANNKAIAVEALYPLAKLIKEAAVTGDNVTVAYKIFGDMADEVIKDMFGNKSNPTVADVNKDFSTIAITGVDIATLAKGAFYAIFSDFATGAGNEKPGEVATKISTYEGVEYKVDKDTFKETYKYTNGKVYEKAQYAWSLDIAKTAATVLKAIKYSGTASQKDKDYSIELSSIATTLKGIFKKATIESCDKSAKAEVAAPSTVEEMMALFMCTNDGILLDLTRHGLLPLYNDGITAKFIGDGTEGTLTEAQALAGGYSAISGKMISKADAILIWKYLTGQNTTLNLSIQSAAGKYINIDSDTDKTTEAKFVENSTIGWFVKFINGTTLINGKNASNVIEYVTGTDSGLKITLNRKDGSMSCDVKLAGLSTTGTVNYAITGASAAYDVTQIDITDTAIDPDNKVVVELNNEFYCLFKAAFGMGPKTTSEYENHGINKDIYYIASVAPVFNEGGYYTSLSYSKGAIILIDASQCYVIAADGTYSTAKNYSINASGTTITIDSTTTYNIYGNAVKAVFPA